MNFAHKLTAFNSYRRFRNLIADLPPLPLLTLFDDHIWSPCLDLFLLPSAFAMWERCTSTGSGYLDDF